MAKRRQRKTSEQESDYDGAWKESARLHFRELLEKYFPATAGAIDWRYPSEWADKELSRILARFGI